LKRVGHGVVSDLGSGSEISLEEKLKIESKIKEKKIVEHTMESNKKKLYFELQ